MSKKRKISSSENDEEETLVESKEKVVSTFETKKKPPAGVIYLSRIPNKMNGQTGRIYLQLSSKFFIFFSYLLIHFF
jgi:hypothetical protein